MSLLYRIIYAAHANGTHHKLALDALTKLSGDDADAWRRVFLKDAALFLEGSKAPDISFKDFKNHVLHVRDNYWGGAPEKVEAWYAHTVAALRAENYADAAYAAGVLSHYYTDPIHPFHTGQTEAENAIHRAVEWSINRSYDSLKNLGDASFGDLTIDVPTGAHWLREFVIDGAEFSHRYYEKLIAHYDFKRGVVAPAEGLDEVGQRVVAELIAYASTGFAKLLDRALAESGVRPPAVSLSVDTLLAGLAIPRQYVLKKLSDAADRRIVERMYDELQATGRVEHSLPEDDRVIRDAYQREVLAPRTEKSAAKREARIPGGDPAEAARSAERAAAAGRGVAPAAPVVNATGTTLAPKTAVAAVAAADINTDPSPVTSIVQTLSKQLPPVPADNRIYLKTADDIERAPSIGPKMAERLGAIGIATVSDLLAADPDQTAVQLGDRRIDGRDIEEWQDQSRLMLLVPGLRGTHAQLLTGAGFRTVDAVGSASPVDLCADILTYAATPAGKRILRDGNPPDIEAIKTWVDAAYAASAAA